MAQNQPPSKSRWGVGSFFQQAVAGVESRLDLILAEPEDLPPNVAPAKKRHSESGAKSAGVSTLKPTTTSISRSSSNARKNDRLQERLARAMVKSNATGSVGGQSSPSQSSVRTSSPNPRNSARASIEVESRLASSTDNIRKSLDGSSIQDDNRYIAASHSRTSLDVDLSSRNSKEFGRIHDETRGNNHDPMDGEMEKVEAKDEDVQVTTELSTANAHTLTIEELQAEHKAAESRWQEEMHGYIERIDALQSKLKYLAKEAAESAKQAAATADPGSVEKQLREKDEKIALLLEEGQKLSKSELDHRTALKKLRQQLTDRTKAHNDTKKKLEKLDRDFSSSEIRARRSETAEKRATEALNTQLKLSRELESITAERNALRQTVQEMQSQVARASARAEASEAKAHSDAVKAEKRRVAELEENLTSNKIEREIAEEKFRRQIGDLKQQIEQEKERARLLELELKGEQSVLETQMESLRSRMEEASSGVAGDAQAKLLRQIETLQTQYAVASENWQTLEGSLLSRLLAVERERDEIARREGDLRRKLREVNLRAKKAEEELDNSRAIQQDLNSRLEDSKQVLQKTEQRLKKTTDDLSHAQKELVEQKKASDASWVQKLEEERARLREQFLPANFLPLPRTDSPGTSRRSNNRDAIGPPSDYRPTSRRSSTMLPSLSDIGIPVQQDSYASTSHAILSPPASNHASSSTIPEIPETHSIAFEPDEFFNGSGTPASPSAFGVSLSHHTRGLNDIISDSTVGAGPSVQLVERMSATVRRLETERAASKDEITRVTEQRDEAREQVVAVMRELEEKRASDAHVQQLEQRLVDLDQRYQTTLELLGEKSEQVEELKADIADLKKIYRELVDSTMK